MIAHKLMDFSMGTMEEVVFRMALEGQDPQYSLDPEVGSMPNKPRISPWRR